MLQQLKNTILNAVAVGCVISGVGSLTGRMPLSAVATVVSGSAAIGAVAGTKRVADDLAQLEPTHEAT